VVPYELRSFTNGGVRLSYEVWGSGPRTIIYLHGILLDAHSNHRLAHDLAERGYRVVLLDLPGHGLSDKPLHAAAHRIDAYARHVVALMDELGLDEAVVGGMSLGADVALHVAVQAPGRVRGMVLEMPVLEHAAPAAAFIFAPLLLATHYAAPVLRVVSTVLRRLPRNQLGAFDQVIGALLIPPHEMAAILHGVLVGPVAPTADERRQLTMPALVIGHRADRLHTFADASRVSRQLPHAQLVEAGSVVELRLHPGRLTTEIAAFLDAVWDEAEDPQSRSSAGRR
jgi:pimeloyl-ACP methyl ester carboxylesterase